MASHPSSLKAPPLVERCCASKGNVPSVAGAAREVISSSSPGGPENADPWPWQIYDRRRVNLWNIERVSSDFRLDICQRHCSYDCNREAMWKDEPASPGEPRKLGSVVPWIFGARGQFDNLGSSTTNGRRTGNPGRQSRSSAGWYAFGRDVIIELPNVDGNPRRPRVLCPAAQLAPDRDHGHCDLRAGWVRLSFPAPMG